MASEVAGEVGEEGEEGNFEASNSDYCSNDALSQDDAWVKVTDSDLDSDEEDRPKARPIHQSPTRISGSEDELRFDDRDAVFVSRDREDLQWDRIWDYEIPEFAGRRVQEVYRFEALHPEAAPVFRVVHGLGHALHIGNFRRGFPGHAQRLTAAVYQQIADPLIARISEASSYTCMLLQERAAPAVIGAVETAGLAIPSIVKEARIALPAKFNDVRVLIPAAVDQAKAAIPVVIEAQVQAQRARQRVGEAWDVVSPWFETGAGYVSTHLSAMGRQGHISRAG